MCTRTHAIVVNCGAQDAPQLMSGNWFVVNDLLWSSGYSIIVYTHPLPLITILVTGRLWIHTQTLTHSHSHIFPLQPLLNGSPEAQCEPSVPPPQYDTLARHNPRHQVKHISILHIKSLVTSKARFTKRRYTMRCIALPMRWRLWKHSATLGYTCSDPILAFLCVVFLRQIVKNR